MTLPLPDAAALTQSEALSALLRETIETAGGWIPFDRYMDLVLFAPRLGYYAGGTRKFGAAGDFVTAPEISPLFGRCLAVQIRQILAACGGEIIEAGPGSGALAAEVLAALEALGTLPERYGLLELSASLRQRQSATLSERVPHLLERVHWLEALPTRFRGVILANELLDALPAHALSWNDDGIAERGVSLAGGRFAWAERAATGAVLAAARDLPVSPPYESEIGLAARAWIASWAPVLERGALVLIDYGFPEAEFYHPQRHAGTLMCHYRHHAHGDPFLYPGLGDITTHVDFTAMAAAGADAGLDVFGYVSQGQFLLNCGLTTLLAQAAPAGSLDYLRLAAGVQKLIGPSEMGELFKVLLLGKGFEEVPLGAARGDRSHRL